MKDYKFISQHALALKTAQQWVENNRIPNSKSSEIWHYEYKIKTTEDGFNTFVVKYTLSSKGERQYYPGAHFSLTMDKNGKILNIIPGR